MSTAFGLLEGGVEGGSGPVSVRYRSGLARPPPGPRPPDVRTESHLATLAREPAPLRRALARVAGRLIATRGWERLGFARLGDYAVERAGVSARELRDLAGVDRALEGLPALEKAFLSDRIGWTQLRLLCRVAHPEDEQAWLALAAAPTTRQLAREVRAVDRCARGAWEDEALLSSADSGEKREGVVLRCTPRARARWWHARQVANRVAGHTLSQAEFAEVLAAEVGSSVPPDGKADGDATTPCAPVDVPRCGSSPLPAPSPRAHTEPSPVARALVAALERDLESADAFELDARLRRGLNLEARRLAEVAAGLADVAARRLHCGLGFRSLDAYASQRLGMAPSRARALIRIARASSRCRELGEAFTAGRISWVQAHALVSLLLEPGAEHYRASWVRHAQRVSVRRLRDDVESALASGALAPPLLDVHARSSAAPADLQTSAIARQPSESVRLFFSAPPEVAHLFRATLATVQREIEQRQGRTSSRSEALEAMIEHAVATWENTDPQTRSTREQRVFARDGWRCTAPGCSSYRNLHAHHVVFRSAGGSDAPGNLTTLCAWHHLRGVHAGVIRCTGRAPRELRFELGVRPGRPPVVAYASGDVLCAG